MRSVGDREEDRGYSKHDTGKKKGKRCINRGGEERNKWEMKTYYMKKQKE